MFDFNSLATSKDAQMFLYGFLGSLAIEVVTLWQIFQAPTIVVPERFKRKIFYVIRFILAVIGGGLAVIYDIDKPLLAVNIGVATPLILQGLATGFRPPDVISQQTQ